MINPDLAASAIEGLCAQLPDNMQARAKRYKSTLAAKQHVIGRLLLRDGLLKIRAKDTWDQLSYSDQGKPILPHTQFNISHSGHIVICAFSSHGAIGIDLEVPNSTNPQHLKHSFTPAEWQLIEQNPNSLYLLWTRKEAVIKASHYKLQDLHKIDVSYFDEKIVMDGKDWYLRSLNFLLEQGACAALCSEVEIGDVFVEEVNY